MATHTAGPDASAIGSSGPRGCRRPPTQPGQATPRSPARPMCAQAHHVERVRSRENDGDVDVVTAHDRAVEGGGEPHRAFTTPASPPEVPLLVYASKTVQRHGARVCTTDSTCRTRPTRTRGMMGQRRPENHRF